MNVPSKVTEGLKMFKSYRPPKRKIIIERNKNIKEMKDISDNNIDNMIYKVQEEMKQKEEEKNKYQTLPVI